MTREPVTGSIATNEQFKSALMFAGVDVDELEFHQDLTCNFRAEPGKPVPHKLGLWSGSRGDRHHNPFVARVRHVIGASPTLDPELVRSTIEHLQTGRFIDVDEVLKPGPRDVHSAHASSGLKVLQTLLEGFCLEHAIPDHVIDALTHALDECFMNAMYNAPAVGGAALDRTVQMVSADAVGVTFAKDESTVAVVVRDGYGTLTPDIIIDSLSRCYQSSMVNVQHRAGGAGIGLFMLMQNASRLVFNIDPGAFTEVIFARNFVQTRREFGRTAPTLNICSSR